MLARRSIVAAAIAAAVPAPVWADLPAPSLPPPLRAIGAVRLHRPDGAPTDLASVLRPDTATLISFWATWCPPCALEARHLARVRRRIPPARLNILGINVDTAANEIALARFLHAARATYTQARGSPEAYAAFGCGPSITLPRLFVFRPDGAPLAAFDRYIGDATARRIDQAAAAAMAR